MMPWTPRPASLHDAVRCHVFLSVMLLALLLTGWAVQASDDLPHGYRLDRIDEGARLVFDGETVFETAPRDLLIAARITGPRDMTGDGLLNLVIYERIGRSSASLTVFSLAPDGPDVLVQTTGMAAAMRPFEGITADTDLSALLGLPRPSAPAPDEEVPSTEGHWLMSEGSWDEGFAAKLGWVVPEYSETEYAAMLFRCPDIDNPYWVEPLEVHDDHDEVPSQIVLDLDGEAWTLHVAPQYDDAMMYWYAIGQLPRDSGLFAALAEARHVTLQYPGLPDHRMHGGAISQQQRAEIMKFVTKCLL